MAGNTLQLSIDLEAELRKITREQHLNQVHYLVQLVRHALAHRPRGITIASSRHQLELAQDGATFDEEEWQILKMLLLRPRTPEPVVQEVLSRLEERHGIAVLSLFHMFPSVELATADKRLSAAGGRSRLETGRRCLGGYRIRVQRDQRDLAAERRELEFFCAGAATVIRYNGRPINRPVKLADALLKVPFAFDSGLGAVGIPAAGDLCRFTYFKCGVRFGFKRFTPTDGLLLAGVWDDARPEFEPYYARSIRTGEFCLKAHGDLPYRAAAGRFDELDPESRRRIKQVLFGLPADGWAERFGALPLFHSVQREFVLTLRDLAALRERFEAVPFVSAPDSDLPGIIPCLGGGDVHFLRGRLGWPLKSCLRRPKGFLARLFGR
jgi:hypothetical protein